MTTLFPTSPAHQLEQRPPERRWLIEALWAEQAVGIVGGEPKCCKSFLALDIALAVAARRELPQLDEKLYLEIFAPPRSAAPAKARPPHR